MSETADERLKLWQRMGGSGRWGIGVAVDIAAIEARLAALEASRPLVVELSGLVESIAGTVAAIEARLTALESSRPVHSAPETAAAVANDPERVGEPQTLPARETWPPHLRPRDEATAEPAASDGPGRGYRWVEVGEMLESGDEYFEDGRWLPTSLVGRMRPKNVYEYRRRITPADAAPDDAGRRPVEGEPMTEAEMQHALGVAREEIARLTAERDAAIGERSAALADVNEIRHTVGVTLEANRRLYAEAERAAETRDAAIREREEEKQKLREYEHMVMTGRSEQHDRLVAERDAARAEVERHRMTREEREMLSSIPVSWHTQMDWRRFLGAMMGYLDRTKEGE